MRDADRNRWVAENSATHQLYCIVLLHAVSCPLLTVQDLCNMIVTMISKKKYFNDHVSMMLHTVLMDE
jgi:hypothetical protein